VNLENKKNNISGRSRLSVSPTTVQWWIVLRIEDYEWKDSNVGNQPPLQAVG
jgi:hypothetical protein